MNPPNYNYIYSAFSSEIASAIREESVEEDIGQHSWLTADELRTFVGWLGLSNTASILDIGCGAGGPALFLAQTYGFSIEGVDVSESAIFEAKNQAKMRGLSDRASFSVCDVSQGLPFAENRFDAVLIIDAILHIANRSALFGELHRVLQEGGQLLYMDAGVVHGLIDNQEFATRSVNGFTQFCPPGLNEHLLDTHGFTLRRQEDVSENVVQVAEGRLRGRHRFEKEVLAAEGTDQFTRQQAYLNGLVSLYSSRRLCREVYLATNDGHHYPEIKLKTIV